MKRSLDGPATDQRAPQRSQIFGHWRADDVTEWGSRANFPAVANQQDLQVFTKVTKNDTYYNQYLQEESSLSYLTKQSGKELNEKKLNDVERKLFTEAKTKEIDNLVGPNAIEMITDQEQIRWVHDKYSHRIMPSRFIITKKTGEGGEQWKAKARWILLVKSFGSTLQGTFLEGSDLDLYICSSREYDTRHTHDEQVKMLRFLEAELRKSFKSFEERRFEWHVRVPILILLFQSHQHELQVDISVGELDHVGVQKGFVDRLIRAALTKGEVALPMVLLVKRWAKVENLNKAFEGSLSPLAWTLLCLYFLICKDRLPKEALAVPAEEPVPRRNAVKLCQNCPTQQDLHS
eukprot:g9306.t1